MTHFHQVLSSSDLARLPSALEAMNQHLLRLQGESFPNNTQTPLSAMGESWQHLVRLLDVSSLPKLSECPVCQHRCMVGVRRCEHCWSPMPTLEMHEAQA
jgi:hypothetical protein